MKLYLDTSVLVSALTNEPSTNAVQAWLAAQPVDALTISDWTVTEFTSALSLKLRTGQMALDLRNRTLAAFRRLAKDSLDTLEVRPQHFHRAASLTEQFELGLRAGDALHLAVALDHGAVLATLDPGFADAATRLGAVCTIPS